MSAAPLTSVVATGAGEPVARPAKLRWNPWAEEICKFVGKKVCVEYQVGPHSRSVEGILAAFNPGALFCVVATAEKKFFIRVPLTIERARTHGDNSQHQHLQPAPAPAAAHAEEAEPVHA